MTATGNEAVSLAQLKDYAANQNTGGGSGYTYEYVSLVYNISRGNWVIGKSGSANPRLSIYYNENELTIEGVRLQDNWGPWGVTVSSKSGKVHFLGTSPQSVEIYPMYVAVPYTALDHAEPGVLSLKITKQSGVLTVSNSRTFNYEAAAYPRLKFYITEN